MEIKKVNGKERVIYNNFDKIVLLSFLLYCILGIIGFIIIFLGYGYEDKIDVTDVKVNKVLDDTIILESKNENNGDNYIYEMKKPILIKIKEGQVIRVRYNVNDKNKMHYVFNPQIGIYMIVASGILFGMFATVTLVIKIIRNRKNTKIKNE